MVDSYLSSNLGAHLNNGFRGIAFYGNFIFLHNLKFQNANKYFYEYFHSKHLKKFD